jgi:hypothetical protein
MTAGRSGIQRPDTEPGGTPRYRSSGLRLSDPELRRRHPEAELPPLHIAEEAVTSGAAHEASGSVSADQQMTLDAAAQETAGPAALGDGREPDAEEIEARTGTIGIQRAGRGAFRHDVKSALEATRMAEKIIAERERQADHDSISAATMASGGPAGIAGDRPVSTLASSLTLPADRSSASRRRNSRLLGQLLAHCIIAS